MNQAIHMRGLFLLGAGSLVLLALTLAGGREEPCLERVPVGTDTLPQIVTPQTGERARVGQPRSRDPRVGW